MRKAHDLVTIKCDEAEILHDKLSHYKYKCNLMKEILEQYREENANLEATMKMQQCK